jgi:hypothetical protein
MSQEIKDIKISDLVLWTENPRDPIDGTCSDQEIADKAWLNEHEKWNLLKLVREMKTHYDFSELPTVVYEGKKPVVYDGNRRMILAKLKHDLVKLDGIDKSKLPSIPKAIPCNVCSKDIAIENVFRKHGDSGSWSPLDRDLFIHKFMDGGKSLFLKLEDATNIISTNPHLNQGFVKKEIFAAEKLKEMGFVFDKDELQSTHTKEEAQTILEDLSLKVAGGVITTRKNRGQVLEVLEKASRSLIEKNKANPLKATSLTINKQSAVAKKRQAPRTKKQDPLVFGGLLYLKVGQVSDLYRDIADLHSHYCAKKDSFSQYFPSLIRMSLRLLCEAAASDDGKKMDAYISSYFKIGKKELSQDEKTTLSTQNVSETSLKTLLHIGAHNYHAGKNLEQTIAMSIIIGKILTASHGR